MAVRILRIRATNQFPNSHAGAASFSVENCAIARSRSNQVLSIGIPHVLPRSGPKTDTVPRTLLASPKF
ncbi:MULTISPECIES: hypothetical protein [unclassified Microcoleus]|uniref:hypothetical protein n=1 Tax=unclassified Microcoleus TaxID=2642155 RepID=UPI002FCFF0DB